MSVRLPDPSKGGEDTDYARFTFQLWEGLNGKYQFYVERWRRTLEFLRDQHWQTLKEFDHTVLPDWKKFPLQNYTLAFYNDFLTDYLKSEVRFSALPASPDPSDIDAAELSDQLMKFLWNRLEMDRQRIDLGAWIMSCGTGAVRIFWDTDTGNQVPFGIPQPDGSIMPVDPETMQPIPGAEPIMVDAGEIGFEVISPQFVRWAENPAHGVMVGLLLSYEEASTFYGRDVADRLSYSDTHSGISADLNQIEQPGVTPSVDQRALVIEHYLPKSAANPEGLWWTSAANGAMLIHPPWPLPAGVVPIVSFRWIPIPGEQHIGLSPLYGITFENKIYEEITARILEWYQKAKPKRLLKAGGGVTHGDITDEPYQELVVNAGGEPEMLDVDDAPQGLFRMLGQIAGDMQVTSGRAFEEGDALPEGLVRGGFRQTEAKESKAVTIGHISAKASWKSVGEILMHYVAAFYNEGRVVAVNGPDQGFLWRKFSGNDLRSEKGGLAATLYVDEIPLFPQNRQNLRDTVISLLQSSAGQILFADATGAMDMDRIKGALQATGLDANLDIADPDALEARNEEMAFQFLQPGQEPPKPESWQDHGAHHASHVLVPKSMRFKAWSPEAQQAFLQHIADTEEILNEQAQAEADAMVAQEQQLRAVREQEALKADVMQEWAKALIGLVAETTGLEVQQVMDLANEANKSKE
jgi:hypothetical protein